MEILKVEFKMYIGTKREPQASEWMSKKIA